MRHLNYTHLLYFWTVQREGSVARAAELLNLAPQTISGQIKRLEESLGSPLLQRDGRSLVLTDTGKLVVQYADGIFALGHELNEVLRHGAQPRAPRSFAVGVVNSLAKLITCEILAPALALTDPVRIITHEATLEELLADLSIHRLDLVLSDRATPEQLNVKLFNVPLGQSDVAFFAHPGLAQSLDGEFPANLRGAPFLLPAARASLRTRLEDWFADQDLHPTIIAEIDDSALMKAFGHEGAGVFAAPAAISHRVREHFGVVEIGRTGEVVERYYAIVPERRMVHPAMEAIMRSGKSHLDPAEEQ